MTGSIALRKAWEESPRYRYRGCAPDVDEPGRAAGNLALTLDAWSGEDRDGSEPQRERLAREAAAVEVCLGCPVMVACDAYASSVVSEGGKARLAEPDGIWGGRLALERHRAFIKRRHEIAVPAPKRLMQTPQKLRVLEALAAHVTPEAVAQAAAVDVRTANWQRSRLVTQLNLDKETATRTQLLEAAVRQGLLDAAVVVADDGSVPAVPVAAPSPPSPSPPSPSPVSPSPVSSSPSSSGAAAVPEPGAARPPEPLVLPARRRRTRRVRVMPGQLSFDDALTPAPAPAPVLPLFPRTEPMEAAA